MIRCLLLCCVFIGLARTASADPLMITADVAHQRARTGDVTLIDIRSPGEWNQTGVPKGAIAVTMHDDKGVEAFYKKVLAVVGQDKSKPIAVICAAGNRSSWAQKFLASRGFLNIQNVAEGLFGNGLLPGWLARGLPVVFSR